MGLSLRQGHQERNLERCRALHIHDHQRDFEDTGPSGEWGPSSSLTLRFYLTMW
jgi:hypothetical protein